MNSNLKKDNKSFKETVKKNDEVESLFYITKNIVKEEFIHESNIKELVTFNINKNNEHLDKFFSEIVD